MQDKVHTGTCLLEDVGLSPIKNDRARDVDVAKLLGYSLVELLHKIQFTPVIGLKDHKDYHLIEENGTLWLNDFWVLWLSEQIKSEQASIIGDYLFKAISTRLSFSLSNH